jgi:cellulose synthase/poly-beta-1,6-N-acetylglucosamine synthase-like glycosyltransferase
MAVLQLIINVLILLVFVWLAFSAIYFLIFSLSGLFYHEKRISQQPFRKIAVLIPGYKEDSVIVEVAEKALAQTYPKKQFDVVIIADSFQPATLDKLRKLPIQLIEVNFDKSTKAKSLNKAFELLSGDYQIAVILDADNIMEPEFLEKINMNFTPKVKIIQAHRAAKNLNTSFAILDAISEEINNHIFRKGHRVLGLSSALIGSGMACDYHLLRSYMKKITAIGGFDKELEINLLNDRHRIHYLHSALVFDEKIQKPDAFQGQRRRWLSAQFIYFGKYVFKGIRNFLFRGNIDLLDKVFQLALVPRILTLGISTLAAVFILLTNLSPWDQVITTWFWIRPVYWYLLFASICISFILSIPAKFYTIKTLKAMLSLPKGFGLMFFSLINIKGANKKFIHTRHGQT